MKKICVEDAVGATLCHDVTAIQDGFKGPLFRRGHVIAKEDLPKLLDIGRKHIFVWEPEEDEMHEEDCAIALSQLATVSGAHYTAPSEGKIRLVADMPGMIRVDVDLLEKINAIGDITMCSLPDHYPVTQGMHIASMRIVPLVTKRWQIEQAQMICAGKQWIRLLPYRPLQAGIVITGSEVYHGRVQDKFEDVIRKKLSAYPCEISGVTICDDDLDMICESARAHLQKGADFLIFTGGMSVDPDDLTPGAIKDLGGELISHGVPAQPGNMTLVAYLGEIPIIGVPGAAISQPATVLDVLLPQVFAGEKISKQDLVRLGQSGLCQFCKSCHFPNCTFGRY